MTLTLNPSVSIRPLGSEHLRMFRRTIGPSPLETARVSMPDWGGVDLIISREALHPISCRIKTSLARKVARAYGGRLATTMEAVMSRTFMEETGGADGGLICIDSKGVPHGEGNYFINRKEHHLEPIPSEQAQALSSIDKLYVKSSAADAAREKRPVRIYSNVPPHTWPGIFLSGTLHFDIPVGIVIRK